MSGKTKEYLFSPSESAGDIAQFVFDNWPPEWEDEAVRSQRQSPAASNVLFTFRCPKLRSWGWYTKVGSCTGMWHCQPWAFLQGRLRWCTWCPGRVCRSPPVRTISTGRRLADLDVAERWLAASSRFYAFISCNGKYWTIHSVPLFSHPSPSPGYTILSPL